MTLMRRLIRMSLNPKIEILGVAKRVVVILELRELLIVWGCPSQGDD